MRYRYGFNGKEKDDEMAGVSGSSYDYGFRIYNPRIGKFLSVDPLTRSYPMLTPYQFASNTPIQAIDLDGMEKYDFRLFKDKNGKTTVTLLGVETITDSPEFGSIGLDVLDDLFGLTLVNARKEFVLHAYYFSMGTPGHPNYVEKSKTYSTVDEMLKDQSNSYFDFTFGDKANSWFMSVMDIGTFYSGMGEIKGGTTGLKLLDQAFEYGKIKGANVLYKCTDYAADFLKKVAPKLESAGAKITQKAFQSTLQGGVFQAGKVLTANGYHTIQEVVIEGKTFIFDNMTPGGMLKEDYIRTLEVFDKTGIHVGEDAYKLFTNEAVKK